MNSYGLWIATEINEHYDCDNSKESFIKVAMARQIASKEPKILWDLNPCSPNHRIYKDYIDKYKDNFLGGYNYGHFTIADNLSISEERKQEIISQYGVGTVWYKRDILGMRCVAEGNIYEDFANHPEKYIISREECKRKVFTHINTGIDFGGNKSADAFVSVGFTAGLREVIVFKDFENKGKKNAEKLEDDFTIYCQEIQDERNMGMNSYCDSAEQTLIGSLTTAVYKNNLRVNINDAKKSEIKERMRMILRLMNKGRFKVCEDCKSVIKALSEAVYNSKQGHEDERLDDGTSPIDPLDAMEYAIEPHLNELKYN